MEAQAGGSCTSQSPHRVLYHITGGSRPQNERRTRSAAADDHRPATGIHLSLTSIFSALGSALLKSKMWGSVEERFLVSKQPCTAKIHNNFMYIDFKRSLNFRTGAIYMYFKEVCNRSHSVFSFITFIHCLTERFKRWGCHVVEINLLFVNLEIFKVTGVALGCLDSNVRIFHNTRVIAARCYPAAHHQMFFVIYYLLDC